MRKNFVHFVSPGTFVAETSTKPIETWDVEVAKRMAEDIVERYNAQPYGFYFTTRGRDEADLDSKEVKRSPMYYIHCKVETQEEIEARNDPKEEILRSNMRCNGFKSVVRSTRGWSWCAPLNDGDVVLADS